MNATTNISNAAPIEAQAKVAHTKWLEENRARIGTMTDVVRGAYLDGFAAGVAMAHLPLVPTAARLEMTGADILRAPETVGHP